MIFTISVHKDCVNQIWKTDSHQGVGLLKAILIDDIVLYHK